MLPALLRRPRSRVLPVLAAGGLVAAVAVAAPALAATPDSGSLTDTSTSVQWTAGPFAAPNVTGTTGDVTCGPGLCDDFALHVSTPASYGDAHQLTIKVGWANSAADFDVYLLNQQGAVVASAASSSDPEVIVVPPTSGDYTVRVVPYAPLGETVTGTATLTSLPANPAPGTATPPTYSQYGAPESFPQAHNAGEPSLGSSHTTGASFYQALYDTYRATWDDSVSPSKVTWSNVSATPTNGCLTGGSTSLDPIGFTDPATGRVFESQLAGKTSLMCYSDDEGKTWSPSQGGGLNSGVDHQTVGGGPYSPNGIGALPTSSYKNAVYYCSQDIADANCAASHDGGVTFGPAVPMYSLLDCGGLHGHVKVAPNDGTVYVPNKSCGGNQAVAVSEDGGTTWSVRKNPASTAGDSDPSVGIGAKGTVYMGYQAADGTPRVAVSRDKGKTWTDDQNVGASLGIHNVVFPAVVAGDDDRASFAFIGTTTAGNYQDATNFKGDWHLYISTTIDGGAHWKTVDATPTDPVQKGSICTGGTTCGNDRNLLDFMDVTVDGQGRVLVGYADGCTGTCASGGAQNFDALATIARQTAGPRLFAAFDAAPDLTVAPPRASRSGSTVTLSAVVTNRGNKSASGVTVAFSNGTKKYGTTAGVTLAPGQSKTVTLTTTSIPRGTQGLTAVVDPLNRIAESNEGNNRARATITT